MRHQKSRLKMFYNSFMIGLVMTLNLSCASVSLEQQQKAQGNYQVALTLIHEAQKADPILKPGYADAKYREALNELLNGLKEDSQSEDIHYLLGMVYFVGFAENDRAITHLEKALLYKKQRKNAEYPEAENLLGSVFIANNQPEKAIFYLDHARKNLLYATPFFAEENLASAYFLLKKYDLAIKHFQIALQKQPDLCGASEKLSRVYELQKKYTEAVTQLEKFFNRCDQENYRAPNALLSNAYYRMGVLQSALRNPTLALSAWQICSTRFSENEIASMCEKSIHNLKTETP